MFRQFHLDSFPENRIWLKFNEKFHNFFFNLFRFSEIRYLDARINYSTFKQWKNRKHAIPLWFILKIKEEYDLDIKGIEKNLLMYKGPSTSTPILNPNLPLTEDERLV